jgi:hypothetical protein
VLLVATLAACGSDDSSSLTLSTPPPPVTTLLDGAYDLVLTPAPGCELAGAPYEFAVDVESFAGSEGNELRATLAGDGDSLVLEMLYSPPGWLQGSVSTLDFVDADSAEVFVRASGTGRVTAATGGRAEVESGTMSGDVSVDVGGGDVVTCSSLEHGWSLLAR